MKRTLIIESKKTMKTTILFFGILFTMALTLQAQTTSVRLAQLLHGERADRVLNEINEVTPDSLKQTGSVLLNEKKSEILNTIATNYSAQFSESELQELVTFFSSPVSKKWIRFRSKIRSNNHDIILKWSMDLRENRPQLIGNEPANEN